MELSPPAGVVDHTRRVVPPPHTRRGRGSTRPGASIGRRHRDRRRASSTVRAEDVSGIRHLRGAPCDFAGYVFYTGQETRLRGSPPRHTHQRYLGGCRPLTDRAHPETRARWGGGAAYWTRRADVRRGGATAPGDRGADDFPSPRGGRRAPDCSGATPTSSTSRSPSPRGSDRSLDALIDGLGEAAGRRGVRHTAAWEAVPSPVRMPRASFSPDVADEAGHLPPLSPLGPRSPRTTPGPRRTADASGDI